MTIELLPGVKLTPKLLLAKVLEDADELRSVVIIEEYEDRTTQVVWSRQELRDVAFALEALRQDLELSMHGANPAVSEDAS